MKNKIIKISSVAASLVLLSGLAAFLANAQNFVGPSAGTAGTGAGAIGIDASNNLAIGTSTPQSDTKLLIVGTSTGSSYFAIKVLDVNRGPLFVVRSDGSVTIGSNRIQNDQTGSTTTIPNVGNAPSNGALYVNGPIFTTLDIKASGLAIGTTTPQSGGNVYIGSDMVVGGDLSSANSAGTTGASNVTAGVFGAGNFTFPSYLGIGTSTQVGLPQALSVYGGGYFSDNVGIGTLPLGTSTLSVNGIIESVTGGFKFPDGNIQVSAASTLSGTIALTPNSSSPFACDASNNGVLAATSVYTTCVCNGTGWVSVSDGFSACSWVLTSNGMCGFANGVTAASAPSTNLCDAGTASAVSGSGPWTWTCTADTVASCSAPSNLVGHWKFDETSGSTVSDSSGSGNTGSLINSSSWTPGISGNALTFDGINQYVSVPDSSSLRPASNVTVSAWVNPSAVPTNGLTAIVTKRYSGGSDPYNSYILDTLTGSNIRFCISNGTSGSQTCISAPLSLGWQHAAGVYNGSNMYLYINGVLASSASKTGNIGYSSLPLTIGWTQMGSGYYLNATVDDVRVYSTALSAADVTTLFNSYGVSPGACGTANGVAVASAPSTNLCSGGAASAVSGSGPWTWSCTADTAASCSAPVLAGVCGSANNKFTSSAPSTNLCSVGTASAVSGPDPWTWSCTAGTVASCSAPFTSWTLRTSAADSVWYSVTYANGLFVAIAAGTGDRVMTSPDGINWTLRNSAANNQWTSVTYGNGLFVAVSWTGTGNRVMTSPDGINWTSRASAADNNWQSVTYGNGLFVAVADSGMGDRVMTSPDGINWTLRNSGAENNSAWYSVTYANGLFVAVANTGIGTRVMTSPDGINWTSRASAADNAWSSVTYGNGLFVAVAQSGTGNRVMTSPDGITWTIRTSAADNEWQSVTYGNGLFVAVAQSGTGNRVMTSPDGITWTSKITPANNYWHSVTYANGLFVAVAWSGTGNRVMTATSP